MRGIGDQVEESENTKGGMRLYMTHGRRGGGGGGTPVVTDSCQSRGCGRGRRNRSEATRNHITFVKTLLFIMGDNKEF